MDNQTIISGDPAFSADAGQNCSDCTLPSSEQGNTDSATNIENSNVTQNDTLCDDAENEFEKLIKGGKYENAFRKKTQQIIDKRFKAYKNLEKENLSFQPLLKKLCEKYGETDITKLSEKISEQSETEKSNALSDIPSKDEQRSSYEKKLQKAQKLFGNICEKGAESIYRDWEKQSDSLKLLQNDFDISREIGNPEFVNMIKNGVSLKNAYYAVHHSELLSKAVSSAAKSAAYQAVEGIKTNGLRPSESANSQNGSISSKTDVYSMSGNEIRSIIKKVQNGGKVVF